MGILERKEKQKVTEGIFKAIKVQFFQNWGEQWVSKYKA